MKQRGESVASDDTIGDRIRITGRVYGLTTNGSYDRVSIQGKSADLRLPGG